MREINLVKKYPIEWNKIRNMLEELNIYHYFAEQKQKNDLILMYNQYGEVIFYYVGLEILKEQLEMKMIKNPCGYIRTTIENFLKQKRVEEYVEEKEQKSKLEEA